MTPYNYDQYYLAAINDGKLGQQIRGAPTRPDAGRAIYTYLRLLSCQFDIRVPTSNEIDELVGCIIDYHTLGHYTAIVSHGGPDPRASLRDRPGVRTHGHYDAPPGITPGMLTNEALDVCASLHKAYAGERKTADPAAFLAAFTQPPTKTKGAPMSTQIKIEQKTFLNGIDVKSFSDAQLIEKIEQAEAEIARLKNVKTQSTKIKARIAELETGATQLASLLDGGNGTPQT